MAIQKNVLLWFSDFWVSIRTIIMEYYTFIRIYTFKELIIFLYILNNYTIPNFVKIDLQTFTKKPCL